MANKPIGKNGGSGDFRLIGFIGLLGLLGLLGFIWLIGLLGLLGFESWKVKRRKVQGSRYRV
jgi:hypothetical protein